MLRKLKEERMYLLKVAIENWISEVYIKKVFRNMLGKLTRRYKVSEAYLECLSRISACGQVMIVHDNAQFSKFLVVT